MGIFVFLLLFFCVEAVYRGQWALSTKYNGFDCVSNSGQLYYCYSCNGYLSLLAPGSDTSHWKADACPCTYQPTVNSRFLTPTCGLPLNDGGNCGISCSTNYSGSGGQAVCGNYGTWTVPGNETCMGKCLFQPSVDNTIGTCTGLPQTHGTTCNSITCANGYNLVGPSLVQTCNDGSWISSGSCDINACQQTPCSANATCVDLPSPANGGINGRTCTCLPGFSGDGESCIDINACTQNPCGANATCVDLPPPALGTPAGRKCSCFPGFTGDGINCTEINACQTSPCGATFAQCIDKPPPAGNTSAGRTCTCFDGFAGNGDVCTDIDECSTSTTCPSPRCLNSQGSYSCAPQIVSGSLIILSGAEDPLINNDTGVVVSNISGGATLQFNISGGFNFTYPNMWIGGNHNDSNIPPGCPSSQQAISYQFMICNSFDLIDNLFQCTIPGGYGSCLIFTVQICAKKGVDPNETVKCIYINTTDVWSYPHPSLIAGTLRLYGKGSQFAAHSVELDPGNPSVHAIQLDGTNIITDPNAMQITYGPISNPEEYNCSLSVDLSTPTLLVCYPQQAGDLHNIITMTVPSANYSYILTDELQFPRYPNIQSISGCPLPGCPTKGTILTILGYNFDNSSTVLVGGIECLTISVESGSSLNGSSSNSSMDIAGTLICNLQAGVGKNLPVVITSLSRQAVSKETVSFEPPSILNISSPSCTSIENGLIDCPREGGARITIIGNNFGANNALVLIAGSVCPNSSYITPHQVITCVLPPGVNQLQPLSIVQGMQQDNSHIIISYKECLAGTFQIYQNPALGTTCGNCTAGRYNDLKGAATCLPCPSGTYSLENAVTCQPCQSGKWANATDGADSCFFCPSGTSRSLGNSLGCTDCQTGFYTNQSGSTICLDCPPGLYTRTLGATICDPCQAGYYRVNKSLQDCLVCPAGTFSKLNGSDHCDLCPGGTYSDNPGQSFCDDCRAGQARLSDSQAPCSNCSLGTYANTTGMSQCVDCPLGKEATEEGSSACTKCNPGYVRSAGKSCQACLPGSLANVSGLSSCAPCPNGTYSVSAASECFNCSVGFVRSDQNVGGCQSCLPGFMANLTGLSSCVACPEGSYSSQAESTNCTLCPAGWARTFGSTLPCQPCNSGSYAPIAGSATCILCPQGTFSNFSGASSCEICQVGYFSANNGSVQCKACSNGEYTDKNTSSSCIKCPMGKFCNSSGASNCDSCNAGYFTDNNGSVACKPCANGEYTNVGGSATCLSCAEGYWSNASAKTCTPCPPGQSTALRGQPECSFCAKGTYQDMAGQSSCTPCPVGRYQDSFNATTCVLCGVGKFGDVEGLINCFSCDPQGGYTTLNGSTKCTSCSKGLRCVDGKATPLPGYWAYNTSLGTLEAYLCSSGCASSTDCGPHRVAYPDNPMCGKCEQGYSEWGGSCVECHGTNGGIVFLIVLLSWAYVIVIHVLSQEPGSPSTKVFLYFVATAHYLVSSKFYWLSWIWFFDFNVNDTSGTICIAPLDAYQKLALQVFTPLLYFVQLGIFMICHWYFIRFFRPMQIQPFKSFVNPYIRTTLAILLFSYSMITSLCFRYLTCTDTGMSRVVFTMPSINCDEQLYFQWKIVIILLVIFPVIGLPLAFTGLLYKYRKIFPLYNPTTQQILSANPAEDNVVVQRYGILFATYRPKRFYWEIWALLRRALVLAFGNFLQAYPTMRVQVLAILNLIILLLQMIYGPFQDMHEGNRVETLSLISLLILSVFTTDSSADIPRYEQIIVTGVMMVTMLILFAVVLRGFIKNLQTKVIETVENYRASTRLSKAMSMARSNSQLSTQKSKGELEELVELEGAPSPTVSPHRETQDFGNATLSFSSQALSPYASEHRPISSSIQVSNEVESA